MLISGHDGGTGASPLTSIKHSGVPWELGLAETQQVLRMNGLRDRIVVQVDGQMKTGRDVVIAALLGAEEFGFATAPLVVSGCVMMRVCHLNTCPVGIATQDPELRKQLHRASRSSSSTSSASSPRKCASYMAQLGFRTMDEMIGRVDRLDVRPAIDHWKARGLDFTRDPAASRRCRRPRHGDGRTTQDHGLDQALDQRSDCARCAGARARDAGRDSTADPQRQPHGRDDARLRGDAALGRRRDCPTTRSASTFTGSAGQSFGAFVPRGITLPLEGDANDYVGKGLSGGQLVVVPAARRRRSPPKTTSSSATSRSTARPAARRTSAASPASASPSATAARTAVVEGVGDHGCEYMTGGRVVVLGRTGRNFAAGMSGGIAYVLDADRRVRAALQPRDGRARAARRRRRTSTWCGR